ncbi:MAG TPA: hypothetical protein VKB80_18355 [Kofleriaceae bacterium]|nr:hypothetical protein [Kofleriaceae bacterium]
MTSILHQQHADPWSTSLLDVASLNARVSDAVLAAIDSARGAALAGGPDRHSHSFLVLGPAGAGKTHLFARLRRSAGARAAFVLLRPELAVEPTPRHVLAQAVDALRRPIPEQPERSQLDVVVGSAVSVLNGAGARWPAVALDQLRAAPDRERQDALERAVDVIERSHPEIEPDWLVRFLALPFAGGADRRAAFQWLSGREPDVLQLERLGFRDPLPEASVLPALRTLSAVASFSAPFVVVFDQLENLVDEDGGTGRIHSHARLFCELHDTVPGLVLVQMSLEAEWQRRISPALASSERSRMEAAVLRLVLPTPPQRAELMEAWLGALPPEARRPLPWPFAAESWQMWQDALGVTPRMLMIAAREALERGIAAAASLDSEAEAGAGAAGEPVGPLEPASLADSLDDLWDEHVDQARAAIDEAASAGHPVDGGRITSGVTAALRLLGAAVEVASARQPHQLRVGDGPAPVDLYVVQKAHPRSVAAQLERAAQAAATRPVVALREAARPFPPSWRQVAAHLEALVDRPRARWLELGHDEVASLLAVHDLLASARSQDLAGVDGRPIPESDVRSWAREQLGIRGWRAIAALLEPGAADEDREPGPPRAAPIALVPALPRDARKAGEDRGEPPPRPAPIALVPALPRDARKAAGPTHPADHPAPGGVLSAADPVVAAIRRLRLASIDRILREARAVDPELMLSSALDRLRALASRLRWFGRSLVWWEEDDR